MNKMRDLTKIKSFLKTKFWELKNTMNEIKNAIGNINGGMDQAEERLCELEDRNFEILQSEENKA